MQLSESNKFQVILWTDNNDEYVWKYSNGNVIIGNVYANQTIDVVNWLNQIYDTDVFIDWDSNPDEEAPIIEGVIRNE